MSVAGPKFSFDMLDADGDGRITRAEYEAGFKVYIQEQPYQHLGMHAIIVSNTRVYIRINGLISLFCNTTDPGY